MLHIALAWFGRPGRPADRALRIGDDPDLSGGKNPGAHSRRSEASLRSLQWVMFQMGRIGPMFRQYNHFASCVPEKIAQAIER
ncbi:MAG: hypothetical protein ACREFU_14465 [Acetobacteraceae bacterium]